MSLTTNSFQLKTAHECISEDVRLKRQEKNKTFPL